MRRLCEEQVKGGSGHPIARYNLRRPTPSALTTLILFASVIVQIAKVRLRTFFIG